ncbi:MAG TPA: hypothetical protein PKU96_05685 [bacterium]|jgi:hypothetical protein|nr:hypothetical protein [Myxococcales bacterium]OQA60941.1 MAG: hypothetical protein BWY40_00788 [bacterium ADurb.Bin270]HPW45844.1 hypothetical protein [bacterium]HQG98213.1 hypothetical protein [Thermotogota bacterium]
MKKILSAFLGSLVIFTIFTVALAESAHAVKPPTVSERRDSTTREKKKKPVCREGEDFLTDRCVKPKEGQFYRDPKTGKRKMKKVKGINLPWDPK